jgi:acyl-coenzyme A thioesterase PaaI-like protein
MHHPLIRHEPDPDHPGWWTWDVPDPSATTPPSASCSCAAKGRAAARCRMFPDTLQSNLGNVVHGGAILTFIDMALFAGGHAWPASATSPCGDARPVGAVPSPAELGVPLDATVELLREKPAARLPARPGRAGGRIVASWSGTLRKLSGGERGRRALPGAGRGRRAAPRRGPARAVAGARPAGARPSQRRPQGRLWSRLTGSAAPSRPRGIYMWGGVGRGKSMLMDLAFERSTSSPSAASISTNSCWKCTSGSASSGEGEGRSDPAGRAAHRGGSEAARFDEMVINNSADAMILSRLFSHLLDRGVTVVTTSNRPPRDLYKDGLNRELFLPFIDLIERELDVVP